MYMYVDVKWKDELLMSYIALSSFLTDRSPRVGPTPCAASRAAPWPPGSMWPSGCRVRRRPAAQTRRLRASHWAWKRLEHVLNTSWTRLEHVLKTSWKHDENMMIKTWINIMNSTWSLLRVISHSDAMAAQNVSLEGSQLLGRELELKRIVGYVTSLENQVNVVTKGHDGSLASFLFGQPSFVRSAPHGRLFTHVIHCYIICSYILYHIVDHIIILIWITLFCARSVQSCLAERHLPPLVLEGGPGVGRSTLLEAAARRCELLPGLRVLRHRGTAVELLRKLYLGFDEVTDEELLLSPVLRLATGGLVLFLDDLEIGPWLPDPLPTGVRHWKLNIKSNRP